MSKDFKKAEKSYYSTERNLTYSLSDIKSMIQTDTIAWKQIYSKVMKYYKHDMQIVCNIFYCYREGLFNCYYCYRALDLKTFTLDHFYPKDKEKRTGLRLNSELMPCCITCNNSKGNYSLEKLRDIALNNEQVRSIRVREFAEILLPKMGLDLYLKKFNISSREFREHHNRLCQNFIKKYG